jgi:hypothetical protein
MKCDDCLNLLEVYLDAETGERNNEHVREHLMKCASCTAAFEALTAENELFARYDRELEVSPAIWNGIAARIATEGNGAGKSKFSFSEWVAGLFAMPSFRFGLPAAALALIAIVVGFAYWRTRPEPTPPKQVVQKDNATPQTPKNIGSPQPVVPVSDGTAKDDEQPQPILVAGRDKRSPVTIPSSNIQQSDVVLTEAGYSDLEDKDTASHLEQAQNLLISVRGIQLSDDDQEVDVSYEKSESRRLLNDNIVLRRDAEMAGKFPAKSVLGSLEPFLIDIANLPDKAPAKDIRQIRDRVQKTEIVAELRGYEE